MLVNKDLSFCTMIIRIMCVALIIIAQPVECSVIQLDNSNFDHVMTDIATRYQVNKYPTLKLFRNGEIVRKEYRSQRSVDALSSFVQKQLDSGLINIESPADMHQKMDVSSTEFLIILVFNVNKLFYREWLTDKCIPLVREITFENAEELTEEGLPFLILFKHPDDKTSEKVFTDAVMKEIPDQKVFSFLILRVVFNSLKMSGATVRSAFVLVRQRQAPFSYIRMAKYYFEQGGKMFRPTVALLMANACNMAAPTRLRLECGTNEVSLNQYKIGMISEMIHTASLVHDDVIDGADTRRGNASVNAVWGNKMVSTRFLCDECMSYFLKNYIFIYLCIYVCITQGEFMQMTAKEGPIDDHMENYMQKTYKKTASLFTNSCKSVAILAEFNLTEANADLQWRASEYGRHLGLAFQLVDDLLDFVSSSSNLGKPVATDLKLGLSTGPVIFAAQQFPELNALMARKFRQNGDPERARDIVMNSDGIERTRRLARQHSEEAARLVGRFAVTLPNIDGVADVLVELALTQLDRKS
uniref:Thioredoxin domain-containing protein n=1 Tax=Heterorhabditis bacteriophora TaxID=37862 RepID=A0A1I7WNI5_HETBA